jgi:peroxiredoxin
MKNVLTLLFLLVSIGLFAQNPQGLKVGDAAPKFNVVDYAGRKVALADLLKKGKVVITFYRGAWCPYCNRYMSELQNNAEAFNTKNVSVVAVTPETNDNVKEMIDKTKATFSVVYDKDRSIMTSYGVLYKVDNTTIEKYKGYGINFTQRNGSDDNVLPVPATYVIGQNGKIEFVHFDTNYSQRAKLSDIMNVL